MDKHTIKEIQAMLKIHRKHYQKTNEPIANFITSFYWELEMLKDERNEKK